MLVLLDAFLGFLPIRLEAFSYLRAETRLHQDLVLSQQPTTYLSALPSATTDPQSLQSTTYDQSSRFFMSEKQLSVEQQAISRSNIPVQQTSVSNDPTPETFQLSNLSASAENNQGNTKENTKKRGRF